MGVDRRGWLRKLLVQTNGHPVKPGVTVEAPDVTVEAPGVTVDAPGVKHLSAGGDASKRLLCLSQCPKIAQRRFDGGGSGERFFHRNQVRAVKHHHAAFDDLVRQLLADLAHFG